MSVPAARTDRSLRIVKDDPERRAMASADAADTVTNVCPVMAASAFDGSIARGKDDQGSVRWLQRVTD